MRAAMFFLAVWLVVQSQPAGARPATCTGTDPRPAVDVAALGWSAEGLSRARDLARSYHNDALLVLTHNQIVLQDGPVSRRNYVASVRKSILSILIGQAVDAGKIDLDTTIADLDFDQTPPLTPTEKSATLRDLIMSRSGVYLATAAETGFQKRFRPARGTHAPGASWFYNNWDFNVAGAAYEKLTGRSIFEAFDTELAQPTCMQDWKGPRDGSYLVNREAPAFRAYHIKLSARDLARLGQLFLQDGWYAGRQVVSKRWIRESTTPFSDTSIGAPVGQYGGSVGGYGYMWWVATENPGQDPSPVPVGSYSAIGAAGQRLTVIPAIDTVIVWRAERRRKNPSRLDSAEMPRPSETLLAAIMAARLTAPAQPPSP